MKRKAEILIIDDLSSESNLAIEAGLDWAVKLNCSPTLINYERSDALIHLNFDSANEGLEEYIEEIRHKERLLMSKDRQSFFKDNDIEPLFDFSNDIKNIIQKSVERNSKLIVVAYSDTNSHDGFFTGSILDELVRSATIPVLILKSKFHLNPQKILMPFTINEVALDTIEFSSVISNFTDNSIVIPLHIVDENLFNTIQPKSLTRLAAVEKDENRKKLMTQIDMRLKELVVDGSFTSESIVNQNELKIEKSLISTIKMSESDLVILGKNEAKGFFKNFKGSEIEKILNEVSQSLLIVKPFNIKKTY
jgi:nucleotide-binding universal stress UspA family protein